MNDKEYLQRLEPILKPPVFESIVLAEQVFERIGFDEYTLEIENIINSEDSCNADLAQSIEFVYIEVLKKVLYNFGVIIQKEADLNAVALIELMTAIVDLVSEDGIDILQNKNPETYETGAEFLFDCLEEISELSKGYLMTIVEDFDINSIIPIKQALDVELSDGEQTDISEYRKRARAFIRKYPKEDTSIARSYVNNREVGKEFGFGLGLCLRLLWDTFEHLINSDKDKDLIAIELVALGLCSSETYSGIHVEIDNVLTEMDINVITLSKVLTKVEILLSDLEKENEEE